MVELPLPAQRPGEVRSFAVLRQFIVGVRGSRLLHKADLCGEAANIMRCILNSLCLLWKYTVDWDSLVLEWIGEERGEMEIWFLYCIGMSLVVRVLQRNVFILLSTILSYCLCSHSSS